jgi:hypothetical protein
MKVEIDLINLEKFIKEINELELRLQKLEQQNEVYL